MFDRVLLVLLLLLLPLGIVVSRVVTGELSLGKASSLVEQENKIEAMMAKLDQGLATTNSTQPEFSITGVIYASDSGVLKIAGIAPRQEMFVWVWTAVTSLKTVKQEATVAAGAKTAVWEGPVVVEPSMSGVFSVQIDVKAYTGVVEVRLEQGQSTTIVRYDLVKQVQLDQ